jgi:hypothetical protein
VRGVLGLGVIGVGVGARRGGDEGCRRCGRWADRGGDAASIRSAKYLAWNELGA